MKNLLTIASLILFSGFSFAQQSSGHEHSDTICAKEEPQLCLHVGFHSALNTEDPAEFMVHFTSPATMISEIGQLNVDLWMEMGGGHGHGAPPVTITKKAPGYYKVQDAYFMMSGTWIIQVKFDYKGQLLQINVPVAVQ